MNKLNFTLKDIVFGAKRAIEIQFYSLYALSVMCLVTLFKHVASNLILESSYMINQSIKNNWYPFLSSIFVILQSGISVHLIRIMSS